MFFNLLQTLGCDPSCALLSLYLVLVLISCPPWSRTPFPAFCPSATILRRLFVPEYIFSMPDVSVLWIFFKSGWKKFLHSLKSISETSGALDLGGASTQITFVPAEISSESPQNLLYFRLYGKDYQVYTHSFLCYGKDQALQQKLARDLQASTSGVARGGPGLSQLWHTGAAVSWLNVPSLSLDLESVVILHKVWLDAHRWQPTFSKILLIRDALTDWHGIAAILCLSEKDGGDGASPSEKIPNQQQLQKIWLELAQGLKGRMQQSKQQ